MSPKSNHNKYLRFEHSHQHHTFCGSWRVTKTSASHQRKSLQTEQNVGWPKKVAVNSWFLMTWILGCLKAPLLRLRVKTPSSGMDFTDAAERADQFTHQITGFLVWSVEISQDLTDFKESTMVVYNLFAYLLNEYNFTPNIFYLGLLYPAIWIKSKKALRLWEGVQLNGSSLFIKSSHFQRGQKSFRANSKWHFRAVNKDDNSSSILLSDVCVWRASQWARPRQKEGDKKTDRGADSFYTNLNKPRASFQETRGVCGREMMKNEAVL